MGNQSATLVALYSQLLKNNIIIYETNQIWPARPGKNRCFN